MAIIGVSKPYYAKYDPGEGTPSYSEGGLLGKLTEIDIEIESSEGNDLYADDDICESERRFASGTLTVKPDDLSQEVSKAILGLKEEKLTEMEGVTDESAAELIYDDDQDTPYLGLGFIVKKQKNNKLLWRAVVLAKVMFSVPSDAATTQGKNIEWQVPELTGSIQRDDSEKHAWKREATFTTMGQAEAYIKARLKIGAGA